MTVESRSMLLPGSVPTYSVFLGIEFLARIFEQPGANIWRFNKLSSNTQLNKKERKESYGKSALPQYNGLTRIVQMLKTKQKSLSPFIIYFTSYETQTISKEIE